MGKLALSRLATVFCVVGLDVLGSPAARAIYVRDDVGVLTYNNLATQSAFQAAGYLGIVRATASFCSGTLVGPSEFLTAAHCLFNSAGGPIVTPAQLNVGFDVNFPVAGLGLNNVASFSIDPEYVPCGACSRFDVAVVELTNPVNNVTPASIFLGDVLGVTGTIVGYGQQANGLGVPLVGANNPSARTHAPDHSNGSCVYTGSRPVANLTG
jgi:hypothetical protein